MTRAVHYAERDAFLADKVAGSFWLSEPDADGEQTFLFFCPCGCGDKSLLTVGNGFKPADAPSWRWNGQTDTAELSPSVNWKGHWHGWLRGGEWRSC